MLRGGQVDLRGTAHRMTAFIYTCPAKGLRVQGWMADDANADTYQATTCVACQRVHRVIPKTGKVAGETSDAIR